MPARAAVVPRALRHRNFRGSDAVARGLLTADQLRGRAYVRLFRDVYAHTDDPVDHRVRIEAAALLLPRPRGREHRSEERARSGPAGERSERGLDSKGAVIGGRSALCLCGVPEVVEHDPPVEVIVPPGLRFGPIRGLRIRMAALPLGEVIRAPIPRTTPIRSCVDIAREPDFVEAVVALDLALRLRRVTWTDLVAAADQVTALPGARRARTAVRLADRRAESPQESRLRVALVVAGLRPIPQYEVRDGAGEFVARVDMAFVEQRVAVEYEGSWHWEPGQLHRDRQRLDRLTAAGWRVIHVTAQDLRDPGRLVARIGSLLDS